MPSAEAWQSISSLIQGSGGSQLLGFIISFVVIVVFWRNNVGLVSRMSGMDSAIITANVVTVGLIVFIPFTTQGISDPATSDLPLPTSLYAINIALAILSQVVMFEIARRNGLVIDDDPPAVRTANLLSALVTPLMFLASIPVAYLVNADLAKYMWLLLIVIGPLSGRFLDGWARRAAGNSGQPPTASG